MKKNLNRMDGITHFTHEIQRNKNTSGSDIALTLFIIISIIALAIVVAELTLILI